MRITAANTAADKVNAFFIMYLQYRRSGITYDFILHAGAPKSKTDDLWMRQEN
jgi:hypothetical protein